MARRLAEVCHRRGLPLVTDDAWELDYDLSYHPDLPRGALGEGSDLAIGSVHKTLSGLSHTSVLSVGSDRIDTERLKLCFELEESTSASALLLSSIRPAFPSPRPGRSTTRRCSSTLRRWWPPAALSKAPQTNRSTSCAWSPPTPEDVPPVLRQLRGAP